MLNSPKAQNKVKERLGDKAAKVKWFVSDTTEYQPTEIYDLWHGRTVFHFLTTEKEIQNYLVIAENAVSNYLLEADFS